MHDRIRSLREDKDISQKKMAEVLHVAQRTYAYYESGQRMIPPYVLYTLANFHNTSIDYLLGLTDVSEPYPRNK